MTKKLTSFHLIFGIVYFATFPHWYTDLSEQINGIGCMLTIWYNWAAWKKMMGQPSSINALNHLVGCMVLFFGSLLIENGVYKISMTPTPEKMAKALIFLALIQILFGTTIFLQTVQTMRLFTKKHLSLPTRTSNTFEAETK